MTTMTAAGQLLAADPQNRTLKYRLLPYNEPGRTNLGVVTATAGVVELPADARDLVLNLEHEKRTPLGRGAVLSESADALVAAFRIAATRAGDDLLVEAAEGLRTGISVELDDIVIRGGRLLAARLTGAGAVVSSAFPSAQLVAADAGDLPDATHPTPDTDSPDTDDDDTDSPDDDTEDTQVSDAPTDPDTPTDSPDTDNPDSPDSGGDDMSASTLQATRAPAGLPTPPSQRQEPSYRDIVRLLAAEGARNPSGRLYAALSDITPAATSVNDVTQIPQWLGELWDGRTYAQRYAPLLTQATLTGIEIKGWRWTVKPEVGPYAGNKADVPSNQPTTEPYVLTPTRIAGAHDIDRIFRDFNVEEFWTSYWAAMTESYARQVDSQVGSELVDEAPYVAPGTAVTGVPKGVQYIVDGALAIIDTAVPDFAIVSKDLYREVLFTQADNALAYLNLALGLEEGTIESFRIVPGDAAFPADTVVVGARAAATVYQLAGSPIRVEALDIARGGIDVGLFGYLAIGVNDVDGLALVSGTPPVAADADTGTRRRAAKK